MLSLIDSDLQRGDVLEAGVEGGAQVSKASPTERLRGPRMEIPTRGPLGEPRRGADPIMKSYSMTEPELAQHMIWLGAIQAINLDGGGSTTMWVDGMSVNGIVSHPSDNETADHHGERWVSDGLLVFSN